MSGSAQEVRFARKKDFWLGPEGIARVCDWRRRGISYDDIATKIGVSLGTLERWRRESRDFDNAVTATDEDVDGAVEGAFFKRACGYSYDEEVWELRDGVMTLVRVVKKHVPADTRAAMFWLMNRRAVEWRQQQEALPEDDGKLMAVKDVLVSIEEAAGDGDQTD